MATLFLNKQKKNASDTVEKETELRNEERTNSLRNEQYNNPTVVTDKMAELHNSQISENYRLLKDAVERQIATFDFDTNPRASVITPERPIERESEVRERASSLFTADTLDRAIRNNTPEITHEPVHYTETRNDAVESVDAENVFGLSAFAKAVAAVFCAVIVTMLTMISINTQIINEKASKLAELERQQRTLIQRSVKLKNQIEDATSDETIEEFVKQFGTVSGN